MVRSASSRTTSPVGAFPSGEPISAAALAELPASVRAQVTADVLAGRLQTLGALLPHLTAQQVKRISAQVEATRPTEDPLRALVVHTLLASVGQPPVRQAWHSSWERAGDVIARHPRSAPIRRQVEGAIAARMERRLEAWRTEQRRSVLRAVRPPAPFSRLWSDLHALRERFRRGECPEGEADAFESWSTTERAECVRLRSPEAVVDVQFLDETRLIVTARQRADERWALGAIDRVLDAIADPADPLHVAMAVPLSRPAWERGFERLDQALMGAGSEPERIGWRIFPKEDGRLTIRAVACTEKARGGVSTKATRIDALPEDAFAEPADARVAALLDGRSGLSSELVALAAETLVGHPRLFSGSKGARPLTVRRRALSLAFDSDGAQVVPRLRIDDEPVEVAELAAHLADPGDPRTWLRLVPRAAGDELQLIDVQRSTARALGAWLRAGAQIPLEALAALTDRLPQLIARVPVQMSAALLGAPVEADRRPLVRVRWDGTELQLEVRVRPLPELAAFEPGAGPAQLVTVRAGEPAHVERDLEQEPAQVRAALAPLGWPADHAGWRWTVADRRGALDALAALAERASAFQTAWEGAPPVFHAVRARQVSVRVRDARGWFDVDGRVDVDGANLPLDAVLEAIREGSAYIQIRPGVFARLAEDLRRSLAPIAAAEDGGKISAIHTPLLQALAEQEIEVEADPAFHASLDRLRASGALEVDPPETLTAELRPYQADGFAWLARLASWAPGAILADDMGLGKTVQAIALLCRRAADGPALVACPLSVVANWAEELARFAPSLRPVVYSGPERAARLDGLAAGQVVLCTWDLLARDAALAEIRFATVVLDEAQAIKNASTARAKAAGALKAGFVVALSGTPVENRVEELWSLLRVVAPGLLGGEKRFADRYVRPIAARTEGAREALARVVAPFVLRRTKRQVATDLPPRSDVVIHVPLTADERALYERARLEAVVRTSGGGGPQQRFEVFRWLTHLRQLACNPKLIDPGSPIESAKLVTLRRKIADLRETGHRALVFSQFVRHLELAREALEADGVSCRWLTGATDAAARKREVEAFQSGEGDVFLISLGAGGTGLNLTAATYVFHLDPWWNPAKEDQASDRAHRIGQSEPVTVYRLVAEGTIEDKILALHGEKRELADALLAGAGAADQVTTEELVALLAETGAQLGAAPEPSAPPPSTSWVERFAAELESEVARARLTAKVAREYRRSAERIAAWDGASDDAADTARRWIRAVVAGELGTGTDRVFGKPAVNRLLRMFGQS